MSLPYESILPALKYVAGFDNTGDAKILDKPIAPAILVFNGTDTYWATGAADSPFKLGALVSSSFLYSLAGFNNAGVLSQLVPPSSGTVFMKSTAGLVGWEEAFILGIPQSESGIVIRDDYAIDADAPLPRMFSDRGLVYIDDDGQVTPIENSDNGRILQMVNSEPAWVSWPSGTTAAGGVGSIGLDGVVANNTSAAIVNVRIPAITLTQASDGDTVIALDVNVSADLSASVGPGGLDTGSESSSKWYYLYVIADDADNVDAVISESGAAPTLTALADQTYVVLVSVFRNDGSGNIINFIQKGRRVYTRPVVFGDPMTVSNNVLLSGMSGGVLLTTIIPPNVKTVSGIVGGSDANPSAVAVQIFVAADTNGLALQVVGSSITNPTLTKQPAMNGFFFSYGSFIDVPIVDPVAPAIFWQGNVTNTKQRVVITGYTF